MKSLKSKWVIVLCLQFGFSGLPLGSAHGQLQKHAPLNRHIEQGVAAIILQDYSRAITLFDSLAGIHRTDPEPQFFLAAALQSRMMDLEVYKGADRFLDAIEQTILLAQQQIEANPQHPEGYFFKGGAHGYRAYYHAKRQDYFRGFKDALTAVELLEKTLAIDSTYYDAYLGLGTYKYWRSRLTDKVDWLPFFEDESEAGLAMIHKSAKYGVASRAAAINALAWIQIDRRQYAQSIKLSLQMLEAYPNSRFFLWPLADAYFSAGYFAEAIRIYGDLRESYAQEPLNNGYNEFLCGYRMVLAHRRLGQVAAVCSQSSQLLDMTLSKEVRGRLEAEVATLRTLSKDCNH